MPIATFSELPMTSFEEIEYIGEGEDPVPFPALAGTCSSRRLLVEAADAPRRLVVDDGIEVGLVHAHAHRNGGAQLHCLALAPTCLNLTSLLRRHAGVVGINGGRRHTARLPHCLSELLSGTSRICVDERACPSLMRTSHGLTDDLLLGSSIGHEAHRVAHLRPLQAAAQEHQVAIEAESQASRCNDGGRRCGCEAHKCEGREGDAHCAQEQVVGAKLSPMLVNAMSLVNDHLPPDTELIGGSHQGMECSAAYELLRRDEDEDACTVAAVVHLLQPIQEKRSRRPRVQWWCAPLAT